MTTLVYTHDPDPPKSKSRFACGGLLVTPHDEKYYFHVCRGLGDEYWVFNVMEVKLSR